MPILSPLLDLQAIDLEVDAARKRAAELPERAALPLLSQTLSEIAARIETARAEVTAIKAEEGSIGEEVSQIVREIEAADLERYSGKRKNRDEAKDHDASQAALRARQSDLEEREMELLEAAEDVEGRIESEQSLVRKTEAELEQVQSVIAGVEREIESQIAALMSTRNELSGSIPATVISAYERVRAQPRSGGRAATQLKEGQCGACRIQLPVHEVSKMLAEAEEALLQCPQCRRILIRD